MVGTQIVHSRDDPRFEDHKDGTVTPSILVVPLVFDERVIGVINLSDSARRIFEPGMRDCPITANFAALAFETAAF